MISRFVFGAGDLSSMKLITSVSAIVDGFLSIEVVDFHVGARPRALMVSMAFMIASFISIAIKGYVRNGVRV